MLVVAFVLAWLALSVIATLAYVFGARIGYRRGLEQATGQAQAQSPDIAVEVRLPDDSHRAP